MSCSMPSSSIFTEPIMNNSGDPTESLENLLVQLENNGYESIPSFRIYLAAKPFIEKFEVNADVNQLDKFCRYLTWSLDQEKPEHSYIACGFQKKHLIAWIEHIKCISVNCLSSMSKLKPELQTDSKSLSIFLNTVVSLTCMRTWRITKHEQYKQLETGINNLTNNVYSYMITEGQFYESINELLQAGFTRPGKIFFTRTNLHALATLSNKSLLDSRFVTDLLLTKYVIYVISIPAYVHYVHSLCPDGLPDTLFSVLIDFLAVEGNLENCLIGKEICFIFSLLANLTDFGQYFPDLAEQIHPKFLNVLLKLLRFCEEELNISKKSHWHPILGWVSAPISLPYLNTVAVVRGQIEALWKPVYIQALFHSLFEYVQNLDPVTDSSEDGKSPPHVAPKSSWKSGFIKFFKKVIPSDKGKRKSIAASPVNGLNSEVTKEVSLACSLYSNLVSSLSSLKLDALSGLCFKQSSLLPSLWKFLEGLTSESHMKMWIEILLTGQQVQEALIVLFTEALTHLITVLDDQELYEDRKIFTLCTLGDIGHFINNLCYRFLTHPNHLKVKAATWCALKTLLCVLHRRDSRRKFCSDGHWLIDVGRMNQLIVDIDKGRKVAKRVLMEMPHVIKEEARIIFFRKWATTEKSVSTFHSVDEVVAHVIVTSSGSPMVAPPSSLITIHRRRIVEDGYAQLSSISPKRLKGTIRVRFQNELGLDEAGIDQDGVFKEFLEETIAKVFSPTLNLFKATSENLLYPSPLSYLHENHLDLFEFVGKMLGKAVFEGIVVDVHFAPFFVTQMLGIQQNSPLHSVIDELQSLDRELYNSLIYIKHYEGDMKDLELTFSIDQEVLGVLQNVDLIPGGRTIPVTNENKFSYIYLKAHFHLYAQIKEQTVAFLRGFRYLIPSEWLRIFSPPELQRLISGEDSDIDLGDLRRNTQYYGGFHDSHRVIVWLWDILEQDFTEAERRLFLKFVTSCSKPPLLGFTNLDPAFSVRCVEVSDDDDTGDTIGSVLRGFLTLGKQEPVGRLPTSSTCFNLLKLPNYHKKTTLRDKLRYAINSNVGFELS